MSSITCSFLQKQIHHILSSMKATECQETHAVCHATFLHETIGIQWYLRPILRPLHLLDGFFKRVNLSLLNSLLMCVQEGWGLFRYSGFSDLCNIGQKVENEVCAFLASCGQTTFLDQCALFIQSCKLPTNWINPFHLSSMHCKGHQNHCLLKYTMAFNSVLLVTSQCTVQTKDSLCFLVCNSKKKSLQQLYHNFKLYMTSHYTVVL